MKEKLFRLVTGIAGVYHVLLAVAGFLLPEDAVENVIQMVFGVTLAIDPVLGLIVKFTSVYMLAFGVMLLLLATNPAKYRAFALPALILFGLRFLNRLIFFGTMTSAGMTASRNIVGTGLILFFFVAILVLLPKKDD